MNAAPNPLVTVKGRGRSVFTLRAARELGDFEAKLVKASKVPTPAAARAKLARRTDPRYFPSLKPGMSTAEYAKQYSGLNKRCMTADKDFFQPLNTQPCAMPLFEEAALQEDEVCDLA